MLPLQERVQRLRDPDLRARLLAEKGDLGIPQLEVVLEMIDKGIDKIFLTRRAADYELRLRRAWKQRPAARDETRTICSTTGCWSWKVANS